MSKRDAQQITVALMELSDARQALADDQGAAALKALESAMAELRSVDHAPGVPVARAAERLGLSRKTIESWIARGALRTVPAAGPLQVDVESLRRVSRALEDLRRRGQDGNWLQALADYADDLQAQRSSTLREGLEQLRRGDLEPA